MAKSAPDWSDTVLDYWFSLAPEQWWRADDARDADIRERFEALWTEQKERTADSFLHVPDDALAAVILFDQFPRNMYRGHARSYATDHLALAIAKGAVERGYDDALTKDERTFLYMPFQHSENSEDQQRSLGLFAALDDPELFRFARLHHDIIGRFGRFPHRNLVLGREPRADEIIAGDVKPW
jgi:uncharacterized protein (DUF924 family)